MTLTIVGALLAFTLIFLTSLYWKYGDMLRKRDRDEIYGGRCPVHDKPKIKINHDDDNKDDEYKKFVLSLNNDPNNEILIDQGLDIADQIVKNAKNCKISTETKLLLYGLFKQSDLGDINKEEPSKLNYVEHAKWSAWNKCKGKTKLNAKFEYFQLVHNEIVEKFNLKIGLFKNDGNNIDDDDDDDDDTENKGSGLSMKFAVNSKMD